MLAKTNRITSIDIMRGLTLFLMLFVNDLYVPGVPKWMVHKTIEEDGLGLADWVFPGFLFMVGLSIPFAIMAREKLGQSKMQLLKHILIRTSSLMFIGVFIVNGEGYNAALTGINKNLWLFLVYVSIFLIYNNYPKESAYASIFKILKVIGVLGILVLAIVYRSGTLENPGWMRISWWGILGLIGWGYLVSALTYFWLRDHIGSIIGVWLVFLLLNILAQTTYTTILNPIKPVLGVVINGNVPSIVLSGLLIGVLLKKYKADCKRFLSFIIPIGLGALAFGFILRNWFIVSKLIGTPSWVMLCNGISILVFALLFYLLDIKKWHRWSGAFLPAGKNSLTTYLAPDMLYYIIWGLNLNILWYKQSEMPWLAVSGSLLWAFLMIRFAQLLSKARIRLKL